MTRSSANLRPVYIVDGLRTPFLKAKNKMGPFSAADLAVNAGRELLLRFSFLPSELDEVVLGCVMPSPEEANIARIVALRLGCGFQVPAWTVQRNCASGMQAVDSAANDIALGRCDLVLAGGTEAMSRAPLLYNDAMANWLAAFTTAKDLKSKFIQLSRFRPYYLKPVIALLKGLTDPVVNLSMGQTAENLAYRFGIDRRQMDEFAIRSHQLAANAVDNHHFDLSTLITSQGEVYAADEGIRRDSSLERLGQLKPFFDKKFGNVTAGNSSQVTDGAAMVLLASNEAVQKYHLPVLAEIKAVAWAGVDPKEMGLGPVHAAANLMENMNLSLQDIDYWEINEAFAAQVTACIKAWADDQYCKENLQRSKALGNLDPARLNINGGAIAIGHPIGASGARIVLELAQTLIRQGAKTGIAALCIGGGQGGAMLIENVSKGAGV